MDVARSGSEDDPDTRRGRGAAASDVPAGAPASGRPGLDSYRTNIRLPIDPYLGAQPVARLTGSTLDAWMRKLEVSGRADGEGGLSARTVRYVFTILRSARGDTVEQRPVPGDAGMDRAGAGRLPRLGGRP